MTDQDVIEVVAIKGYYHPYDYEPYRLIKQLGERDEHGYSKGGNRIIALINPQAASVTLNLCLGAPWNAAFQAQPIFYAGPEQPLMPGHPTRTERVRAAVDEAESTLMRAYRALTGQKELT